MTLNVEEKNEIAGLEEDLSYCNEIAKIYYDNPEFLENQAKVRGLYLKALRKNGFSKKTAEMIVINHFDSTIVTEGDTFSEN